MFVSMPTGSGKSLCYCMLPGVFTLLRKKMSIVIVVSPLIALMKDQVRMELLNNSKLDSAHFNLSGQTDD